MEKSGGQLRQYSQTPFCSPDKKWILIAQSQIPPLLSLEPPLKASEHKERILYSYSTEEVNILS